MTVSAANGRGELSGDFGVDHVQTAMLYVPGTGPVDLNEVTEGVPEGWYLGNSLDINENGDVCGIYSKGSRVRGFFLKRIE